MLEAKISEIYAGEILNNLDKTSKQRVCFSLEFLKETREYMLYNQDAWSLDKKGFATKSSPGDRMVWSQAASLMSQKQLDAAIDTQLTVIGFVAGAVLSPVITVAALAKSVWSNITR